MKTTNLKWIAYALAALMLMQSCRVYHSKTSTVDEAVMSQKRVKIKSQIDQTYTFNYLIKEGGQLYGITKRKSETAKKLFAQINEDKSFDKFVGILLPNENIKEIHVHNKTLSTILSIGIPVVIVGGIIVGIAISLSDMPITLNFPPGTFPY